MKDAQKPDHVSLNTIISRLKEGRFVIRHSRTVSGVTRMEGEASILWFTQVLGK
jgi:hypothetical protein